MRLEVTIQSTDIRFSPGTNAQRVLNIDFGASPTLSYTTNKDNTINLIYRGLAAETQVSEIVTKSSLSGIELGGSPGGSDITCYGYSALNGTTNPYNNSDTDETFNAYSIWQLYSRIVALEALSGVEFDKVFEVIYDAEDTDRVTPLSIKAKYPLWSVGSIAAGGLGSGTTGSGEGGTVDLTGYATQAWVNEQSFVTQSALNTALEGLGEGEPVDLSGYLQLAGGTLTGDLTGVNATFTGDINGVNAVFSGSVTAQSVTLKYSSSVSNAISIDSEGNIYVSGNFYATGSIAAGGVGGSGSSSVDLTGYATQAWVTEQLSGYAASAHTHDYVTAQQLSDAIAGVSGGGSVDLTGYATETWVGQQLTGYSATNHNHDSSYAAKTHSHDYAATNHNHNSTYAALSHTHDYAASNHTHASYASEIQLGSSTYAISSGNRIVINQAALLQAIGTLSVEKGGTGLTTLTAGSVLVGNGTGSVSLRSVTNNTVATAVSANTNIVTANTLYYHTGSTAIAWNASSLNLSSSGSISWNGVAYVTKSTFLYIGNTSYVTCLRGTTVYTNSNFIPTSSNEYSLGESSKVFSKLYVAAIRLGTTSGYVELTIENNALKIAGNAYATGSIAAGQTGS